MSLPKIKVTKDGVWINGRPAKRKKTGSARMCYTGSGYIVKVDRHMNYAGYNVDGTKQAAFEIKTWKRISKNDRKYFQKIVDYDLRKSPRWVAQKIIPLHKGRRKDKHDDKIYELTRKYELSDVYECPHNWTVLNDRPIIFDYGL